jgi:hypothetical protein
MIETFFGKKLGVDIINEVYATFDEQVAKLDEGIKAIEEEKKDTEAAHEAERKRFEETTTIFNNKLVHLCNASIRGEKLKESLSNLLK